MVYIWLLTLTLIGWPAFAADIVPAPDPSPPAAQQPPANEVPRVNPVPSPTDPGMVKQPDTVPHPDSVVTPPVVDPKMAINPEAASPQTEPSAPPPRDSSDRKSTRLNSSHSQISYAVFCLKK